MKIKIEIEIREDTIKRIKKLGETPYKEVPDAEARWWDLSERVVGGIAMVKIARGEYEKVEGGE